MSRRKRLVASRLIVVDADVVRGASATDGGPPAGVACRSALQTILRVCHRAVVSPALANEYREHASNFGERWRTAMYQRSKILTTNAAETKRARGWLQGAVFTVEEREVVKKDLHLVMAACERGAVILSADSHARALFSRLADLSALGWAPISDRVHEWLQDGAAPEIVALGLPARRRG